VDLWLCRSGTGPLSLSYTTECEKTGLRDFRPHKTLDIFSKHSARWKRIRFVFDLRAMPFCIVTNFPSLECVEIDASGWTISFHSAPNLHRVVLHIIGATPFETFQQVLPDRQKLTDVALTCSLIPKSMVGFLHLCPQLQSLRCDTLSSSSFPVESQISWLPVEHLALQSLELLCDFALWEFFNHVTLPMLSSIKVECARLPFSWRDYREFESFLSRSACALQKLSLVNVYPWEESHLVAILRVVTNSLIELHLVGDVSITEGLIKVLTVRSPKTRPICSKLTILWLDIHRASYTRHWPPRTRTKKGLLADMARSRWAAFRHDSLFLRLKAISVRSSRHSAMDLRLLKEYSTQGLEVTLLD
jgi:hypothetical protein